MSVNKGDLKIYCVYFHKDDEGGIFYVGIGSMKRANDFSHLRRSEFWKNYVNKHCTSGKPTVQIVHENLDWMSACEQEKFWIEAYGRRNIKTGCLVNLTDGGEGTVGAVRPEELRQKISDRFKGKPLTDEHRKKLSEAKRGNSCHSNCPHSDESKAKISAAKKGVKKPAGSEEKRAATMKLIRETPGYVDPKCGRKLSEEHRDKIGAASRGKPTSPAHKQAVREWWARRKEKLKQQKTPEVSL